MSDPGRRAAPAPETTAFLVVAVAAMFAQETFVTLSKAVGPVIAPAILTDLGVGPAYVGVYTGILASMGIVGSMGCGSFIVRYGPMRTSQAALVLLSAGLVVASVGWLPLFALAALIADNGQVISTPSSSHMLRRIAPPRQAPLAFSIAKSSVPVGLVITGFVGPWLALNLGWRGALLVTAGVCVLVALALQPLRGRFDVDRKPDQPIRLSDVRSTLVAVIGRGRMRTLALTCLVFNGVQSAFAAYFVIALTDGLGLGLGAAGALFSTGMAVAVPGRIVWGWIGGRLVPAGAILVLLAAGMALSAAAAALATPAWSPLALGAVAAGFGATALSWHGILLAEVAFLAPEGRAGAYTGGVLAFGQMGALLFPLVFAVALLATGSYAPAFIAIGLPALAMAVALIWVARR
ncbi:MAG: MFS transporter [Acetobacterales bacterium]